MIAVAVLAAVGVVGGVAYVFSPAFRTHTHIFFGIARPTLTGILKRYERDLERLAAFTQAELIHAHSLREEASRLVVDAEAAEINVSRGTLAYDKISDLIAVCDR